VTLDWLPRPISAVPHELVLAVGLVVAVAVTIHVLLRKRDIGAAIGWIGLAWLSPILGGLIYFVFGINRVRRRARKLRDDPRGARRRHGPIEPSRDDHLAPLERAATAITGRPPESGNAVRVLHHGDEAYPDMLAAIAGARDSIALSSYILRDDEAGGTFIDALIAARQRGVETRVLIDGIGGGYFLSPAFDRLSKAGVPAARFMHSPLPWRMPFLNLRTHKKILVVDGRIGFSGGMNISAQNVLASHPREPVRDTHFRWDGPVVRQLTEAFVQDWNFATDETLDGPAWFPGLAPSGQAVVRVVTSGPDQDLEKIMFLVLSAISCARASIVVMTPYFLPEERLVTALALASLRGVSVDIVVPRESDHRMIDWATRAQIGPMLDHGCRLWLNPPPFDHSKIMVVDECWCLVGSSNWDMRSLRLNFELDLEVYHSDLAAELSALAKRCMAEQVTVADLNARRLPARLRDAGLRLLLPYI
jgi:cardiolipin synthase